MPAAFTAGMVASIRATMGMAIPRTVTTATDRVQLAAWNGAGLERTFNSRQMGQSTLGRLGSPCSDVLTSGSFPTPTHRPLEWTGGTLERHWGPCGPLLPLKWAFSGKLRDLWGRSATR